MIKARDYQTFAVKSLYDYFGRKAGNPLVAMPTGTGKSVVIALFLQSIFAHWANQKIMILTHVKELIDQNYAKLKAVWPEAPAGIYSAGLSKRDHMQRIIFGGIASVARKFYLFGHVDLLMIDECHLVSPTDRTMYQGFINALKKVNPYLKVIGLTATPWRLGQGHLVDEENSLFTDVCCDMTTLMAFNWFIDEGYLVKLVPKATTTLLATDGVHMRGGEFIANELQAAVDKRPLTEAALREALELGHNRRSWLLFCSGVDHAKHVAEMLDSMGVSCKAVYSGMPNAERDAAIADWKAGRLRAISNNNVMTTGIDHPMLDLIVMLRPTASTVLWVQMLGRGTRPDYFGPYDLSYKEGRLAAIAASQKQNCMVLDFAGNTRRLGPINDPVIPRKKGEGGGTAPVKECVAIDPATGRTCKTWNHASVRECFACGQPFPAPSLKIQQTASVDELVKVDLPVVETKDIDHVTYSLHTKTGKPPMVRVVYYCGLHNYSEFICVEHEGFAKHKANQWLRERLTIGLTTPVTSIGLLAIVNELRVPTRLEVWVNKQFPQIQRFIFEDRVPTVSIFEGPKAKAPAPTSKASFDDDIPF